MHEASPKGDVPGFRQDEFFELDFDPGKAEAAAGGESKIRGKPFQQFAGDAAVIVTGKQIGRAHV